MKKPPAGAYRDDLAYIHDAGFGGFAGKSAPWLLDLFRSHGIARGTVVDLGCGSGIWAEALVNAGYDVVGFDISAAMIALSQRRVPAAEFCHASFLDAKLPPCVAVTAMGEIFCYLFDSQNTLAQLARFFRRAFEALCPLGLLVFDVATPGRVGEVHRRGYTEGEGWACLFEADEDRQRRILTRRITSFRKVGKLYRRDHEVHRLRLYDRAELASRLRTAGFRVRAVDGYGEMRFPPGYVGFVARKP